MLTTRSWLVSKYWSINLHRFLNLYFVCSLLIYIWFIFLLSKNCKYPNLANKYYEHNEWSSGFTRDLLVKWNLRRHVSVLLYDPILIEIWLISISEVRKLNFQTSNKVLKLFEFRIRVFRKNVDETLLKMNHCRPAGRKNIK